MHWTNEKRINPRIEVEARSGCGYRDLSAGWSNTTLLQCFAQIPSTLLSQRQFHIPSNEPPLACTFSIPLWINYFLWKYLKDRVYAKGWQLVALSGYNKTWIWMCIWLLELSLLQFSLCPHEVVWKIKQYLHFESWSTNISYLDFSLKPAVFGCLTNAIAPPPIALELFKGF